MALLRRLQNEGKTLLVVEHNTRVVQQIADDVLFLHQGHLMAQGTPRGNHQPIPRWRKSISAARSDGCCNCPASAAGYGAKTVISDVSFALEPGQILAFLGHNGAGKTTTLKTVMGLLPARAGEVTFDGQRIDRMDASPSAWRWACGCCRKAAASSPT